MRNFLLKLSLISLIVCLICSATTITVLAAHSSDTANRLPNLTNFANTVTNGSPNSVRGVYVNGVLALNVVPQPTNNPGYVEAKPNTVTLFQVATNYGTIGLLAHNYLAGEAFFKLDLGQEIKVIYGDGAIHTYQVTQIYDYQALDPQNTQSEFVDLKTGTQLSANQVFQQMYTGKNKLTFQTCLTVEENPNWGRHFVVATRIS